MIYKLVIPGTLPGLNEYLQAERRRSGRYNCGNEMKQHWQAYICAFIRKDLGRKRIEKPVRLHYTFYEPTKRRDLDNNSGNGTQVCPRRASEVWGPSG